MTLSLRSALVVGAATALGAARNRLLLVTIAFGVALVGASVTLAALSVGERGRLIIDIGLAATSAFGSIMAVALAITGFAGEIEKRTAYVLLARPMPRWAFILGKYVGVVAIMDLVVSIMVLATAATVWLYGEPVPAALGGALVLAYAEMAVVVAVGLLFSTLSKPVLATTYTAGVLIAGNLAGDVTRIARDLVERGEDLGHSLQLAYHVLPNMEKLSVRMQAANNLPVPGEFLLLGLGYAGVYSAALLCLAMLVFMRREAI